MKWKASQALPELLYSAEQTRALDSAAINSGIPGYELMNRAGKAAFTLMHYLWPHRNKLLVCCGAGNNAGDGYVLASLARAAGYVTEVFSLIDPADLKNEARQAWQDYENTGGVLLRDVSTVDWSASIIVDALLGTGLQRPLTGEWADTVNRINQGNTRVLALDIPSGIHADTGAVMGVAVKADATISFIGLNTGLLTGEAPGYTGEVHFADLDIPAELVSDVQPRARRISLQTMSHAFPRRAATDHKGDCGHVLVAGGVPGFTGAAIMAARAALRAGAGLSSVVTRPESLAALPCAGPELMLHAVEQAHLLKPLMAKASVAVLGPGLGQSAWSQQIFATVTDSDLPMVLDADGLNLLAANAMQRSNWVLTPHPGEAARLLAVSTADIQSDRIGAAEAIVQQYGGICVLKGSGTVVAGNKTADADMDNSNASICDAGSTAMASGGMGDVLAGVIAALMAQGLTQLTAAKLGVVWHAAASDQLSMQGVAAGQLAGDLIEQLPHLRSAVEGSE